MAKESNTGKVHVRSLISGIPMFSAISSAELDSIAAGSKMVSIRKGDALFHQGDRCSGFYQVLSGSVRLVFMAPDGREHIAKISAAGDHFAEAVMFLDKPYPLDAFAIEDATLLFIGKDAVNACLKQNPDFARVLIANLSAQLHHFANQIATLTLYNATQRVVGYLLRYIETGEQTEHGLCFTLPARKHDIASHLNISPETLSRTFRQLEDLGLMRVEARNISIPDIEKFRRFGTM